MTHEADTPAGSDPSEAVSAPQALQVLRELEASSVPLSSPLPEGLPPSVADLLGRHGIVARGQAAAAIARLILRTELREAAAQDEADLWAALGLIGVAPEAALHSLIAPFPAPPAGVPLDGTGTAARPDGATPDSATTDDATSVPPSVPVAGKPESEANHG